MSVSAEIVADSTSVAGIRLTTVQLRYPRMVHAELMTHRVFSRNARSSRAVPAPVLLEEDIYTPHFMKNAKGMTAFEELSPEARHEAEAIWRDMADYCARGVRKLFELSVHKQWTNRPLEWSGYIDTLVSSTSWNNFYALRDDKNAQPEMREIAQRIRELIARSRPTQLLPGQWHLPYVRTYEDEDDVTQAYEYEIVNESGLLGTKFIDLETAQKLSAARCARLSIRPFDGNDSIEHELARYELLIKSIPPHASPLEHQATPDVQYFARDGKQLWLRPHLHGNFIGWVQYRKTLPNEVVVG